MKVVLWLLAAALAVLAVLFLVDRLYPGAGLLAAAAASLFPPLWKRRKAPLWLRSIGAVALLVAAFATVPPGDPWPVEVLDAFPDRAAGEPSAD